MAIVVLVVVVVVVVVLKHQRVQVDATKVRSPYYYVSPSLYSVPLPPLALSTSALALT